MHTALKVFERRRSYHRRKALRYRGAYSDTAKRMTPGRETSNVLRCEKSFRGNGHRAIERGC